MSSVDPSELSLLRKQPRLRSIEVADSDFYTLTENNDTSAKAASLHELVQLREITINPRMRVSDQSSEDAQTTRQFKRQAPLPVSPVSPALCSEIRLLPNLRRIAIGERGANSVLQSRDEGIAHAIAGRAKTVQVNGRIIGGVSWISFVDIMLSILLVVIVFTQLQQQFSSSMSLLLPGRLLT